MKTYLFSIFVRGFLAFSGFLVFVITAKLFGADGRGVIGYGTSLFASIGIILSMNLGRTFLKYILSKNYETAKILPTFLSLNIIVSLVTILFGVIYWYLSDSAKEVLTLSQVVGFSLTSFFYVWSHNGHLFFSSLMHTKTQDFTIFGIRSAVLLFLVGFLFLDIKNITIFIWGYSLILFFGAFIEIYVLHHVNKVNFAFKFDIPQWKQILSNSWWPHLDYISFNVFPLALMVFSAAYVSKSDIGKANFATQIVSLAFLLSTTANMRITAYVAGKGFREHLQNIKKLFIFTGVASVAATGVIFFALTYLVKFESFSSFEGVADLFLLASLSIPGFAFFQFFNPIWIELNILKSAAIFDIANMILCLALIPFVVQDRGALGLIQLFSIFHINVFLIHSFLFFKLKRAKPISVGQA